MNWRRYWKRNAIFAVGLAVLGVIDGMTWHKGNPLQVTLLYAGFCIVLLFVFLVLEVGDAKAEQLNKLSPEAQIAEKIRNFERPNDP